MRINKKYWDVRVNFKSKESNYFVEFQKQQLVQSWIKAKNIWIKVGSSVNEIKNQTVFQQLIQEELQANDLVMITKIDWCRINTLEFFKLKNINFVALDLPNSIDLATNKIIYSYNSFRHLLVWEYYMKRVILKIENRNRNPNVIWLG